MKRECERLLTRDLQVDFNVFGGPRTGQPWGEFSLDTDMSASVVGGPNYHEEPVDKSLSVKKVSLVSTSSKWDTVLLSRLRFKPDVREPTSL
jgi:abelson tyrosine-protein kinase 1